MDFSLGEHLKGLPGPVLITGHTGFKGTWMTLLLEKLKIPVIGYSLPPAEDSLFARAERRGTIPEAFEDVRNFQTLSNFISTSRPSVIVHMAAQPLVLKSYENPRETFDINVMGTANIVDIACKVDSVKAVIVVTTDKVYRNNNNGNPFVESDPLGGKDPYSASKVATESVVDAWRQVIKFSSGPVIVAARAGNVIGGGDFAVDRILPDLIRGFFQKRVVEIRNPNSTRPWQHVLDPVVGYLQTAEAVVAGKGIDSINFAPDDSSLTVSQIVEISRNAWGSETNVKFSTEPNLDRESVLLDLDPTFAKLNLGWKPVWTQQQAVESTIQWWTKYLIESVDPIENCNYDIDLALARFENKSK
jgi:CDP-glucose 4,6-dehydratase